MLELSEVLIVDRGYQHITCQKPEPYPVLPSLDFSMCRPNKTSPHVLAF
jgi:hypothetical protein